MKYLCICLVIVVLVVCGAEVQVDTISFSETFNASGVVVKTPGIGDMLKAKK